DPHREGGTGRRGLPGSEDLRHVSNLGRKGLRAPRPPSVVFQQVSVTLHRRTASGRVDGNQVASLEGPNRFPRKRASLCLFSRMELEGTAATRKPRRDYLVSLGRQNPLGGGVDLRE